MYDSVMLKILMKTSLKLKSAATAGENCLLRKNAHLRPLFAKKFRFHVKKYLEYAGSWVWTVPVIASSWNNLFSQWVIAVPSPPWKKNQFDGKKSLACSSSSTWSSSSAPSKSGQPKWFLTSSTTLGVTMRWKVRFKKPPRTFHGLVT